MLAGASDDRPVRRLRGDRRQRDRFRDARPVRPQRRPERARGRRDLRLVGRAVLPDLVTRGPAVRPDRPRAGDGGRPRRTALSLFLFAGLYSATGRDASSRLLLARALYGLLAGSIQPAATACMADTRCRAAGGRPWRWSALPSASASIAGPLFAAAVAWLWPRAPVVAAGVLAALAARPRSPACVRAPASRWWSRVRHRRSKASRPTWRWAS